MERKGVFYLVVSPCVLEYCLSICFNSSRYFCMTSLSISGSCVAGMVMGVFIHKLVQFRIISFFDSDQFRNLRQFGH